MPQQQVDGRPLLLGELTATTSSIQGKPFKPYSIGRVVFLSADALVGVLSGGIITASTAQTVLLPLYLSTFGYANGGGPYFMLWFFSFWFAAMFGVWSAILIWRDTGHITPAMRALKWHPWMALIGACDTLSEMLTVFASPLTRVSGPLQAVLSQVYLPITILLSKLILRKVYNRRQLLGAAIVIAGAFVAMVPTLPQVSAQAPASHWWWPLVLILANVPQALMNICQEKMQRAFRAETVGLAVDRGDEREFSAVYFQFVESMYQWAVLTALFWFDLLPHFGTSQGIDDFWTNFLAGWHCFLNTPFSHTWAGQHCSVNALLAIAFVACDVINYVFSTLGTRHASANMLACVSAATPVLAVIFWFVFPGVSVWAGQPPPGIADALYNGGSLAVILVGIYLFHKYSPDSSRSVSTPTETIDLLIPANYRRY